MLYVFSGDLKEGKDREYRDWVLREYIEKMQEHAFSGWRFMGIYGPVMNLGSRNVTEIWELDKMADVDKVLESNDPVVNELLEHSMDFFQPGSCRAEILRDVKDWPY